VLTGINLGDFGISDGSIAERKENFFGLIRELDKVDEIQRFRISSIEPNLLSNEIIEFVSGSRKFMPHFHIPLQSGSNRILGLMRRRYKRELYADRVGHIKEIMPHCAIGADVIVGFPTESDKDFEETVAFIQSLDISYLHAFTYSERNNTSALDLRPIVHVQKRHERNKILRSLSFEKMQNFTNSQTGQFRKVLFETETRNGMMHGYTDNYIQVATPFRGDWSNQIVEWKL